MLVLFDGVCRFCHFWVSFIIPRDPGARFRFATLQGPTAARLLAGVPPERRLESMVLVDERGELHFRSSAALRIARSLRFPWPLLYPLVLVPAPFRDWVYGWVAARRYRLFGKLDQCPLPPPEQRARFLD